MTLAELNTIVLTAGVTGIVTGIIAAIPSLFNHRAISRVEISVDGNLKRMEVRMDEAFAKGAEAQRSITTATADAAALVLDQAATRAIAMQRGHQGP